MVHSGFYAFQATFTTFLNTSDLKMHVLPQEPMSVLHVRCCIQNPHLQPSSGRFDISHIDFLPTHFRNIPV